MIIISNTTPLNYPVLIEQQDVLRALFGRVIIPQGVLEELQRDKTPRAVKEWIAIRPEWLEVRTVQNISVHELNSLDAGEREAILLAEEISANALLMDDKDGRKEAAKRSMVVIGTLGVLEQAAERDLIDLTEAIDRLRQTTFRAPKEVIEAMLERGLERKANNTIDTY